MFHRAVFAHPLLNYDVKMMLQYNIGHYDYVPTKCHDFDQKEQKEIELNVDFLYDQTSKSCIDRFFMFIRQDYFRNYSFLAFNRQALVDEHIRPSCLTKCPSNTLCPCDGLYRKKIV